MGNDAKRAGGLHGAVTPTGGLKRSWGRSTAPGVLLSSLRGAAAGAGASGTGRSPVAEGLSRDDAPDLPGAARQLSARSWQEVRWRRRHGRPRPAPPQADGPNAGYRREMAGQGTPGVSGTRVVIGTILVGRASSGTHVRSRRHLHCVRRRPDYPRRYPSADSRGCGLPADAGGPAMARSPRTRRPTPAIHRDGHRCMCLRPARRLLG